MKKVIAYFLLLILIVTCMINLSACDYVVYFPKEGIWYCDELQIQLDCADGFGFVMVENTKVKCAWGADRGSATLIVMSQDFNTKYYQMAEAVFVAEQVALSDTQLVVKTDENVYYIFDRIK